MKRLLVAVLFATCALSLLAATPPSVVSITPNTGQGNPQTFVATYSDANGQADFYKTGIIFNPKVSQVGSCYVYYLPKISNLYIQSDDGSTSIGPIKSGTPTGNSQCTVNSYSVSTSGNNLQLTVAVSFSPSFTSNINLYMYAGGYSNLNSGWQQMGTWSPVTGQCGSPTQYVTGDVYMDYATMSNVINGSNVKLDANGVPMVLRGTTWVYNPVTIEQYGLQQWSYYKANGTASGLTNALIQANWLVANQDATTGSWFYNFAFAVGGMGVTLNPPWASSMAQGQGMSLLVRAYTATNDSKFLNAAVAATAPMTKTVAAGGLTDYFQGLPYYEEYPTNPPSFTLNGFMYTLFGLYDLSTYNSGALSLYNSGLQTLDVALPFHDMGDTSAYHLGHLTNPPRVIHTSPYYHGIHVTELRAFSTIAPKDKIIAYYAGQWCSYLQYGIPTR